MVTILGYDHYKIEYEDIEIKEINNNGIKFIDESFISIEDLIKSQNCNKILSKMLVKKEKEKYQKPINFDDYDSIFDIVLEIDKKGEQYGR